MVTPTSSAPSVKAAVISILACLPAAGLATCMVWSIIVLPGPFVWPVVREELLHMSWLGSYGFWGGVRDIPSWAHLSLDRACGTVIPTKVSSILPI